ncbi:MAG: hypothetical protein M0024_10335 [Nitrospiraceae bacterium]|nr:hypothetical protein [Nitrospiraceae bacterium]
MAPGFAVFLTINNSLHDAATALPAAGALTVWLILRNAPAGGEGSMALLMNVYRLMARLMKYALAWICIGAIPRLLSFSRIEWQPACDRGHGAGLIARNIFVLGLVVGGVCLWIAATRKMKSRGLAAGPTEQQPGQTL